MRHTILLWLIVGLSFTLKAQINGSFTFGGQTRTYIIHIPASYQPPQSLPLVFVLHGFTQSAQAIQQATGFDNLSDAENFFVVYANGVNNAWNTNSGFPGGSTADDVGFINALIDTMQANYNIDPGRVYSCGFSAGGFMSHRLACESTNRFAAIASVAGTMSDVAFTGCTPSRAIPVMQIHGTSDAIVSYNGGIGGKGAEEVVDLWKSKNQCPVSATFTALPDTAADNSTVEQYAYTPCSNCSEVVLLKVVSGGHQWPGATGLSGLGNLNRDINASIEIWNFFKKFTAAGCTHVEETSPLPVKVFPNPTANILYIETSAPAECILTDLAGRVLGKTQLQAGHNSLPVSQLSPGSYLISSGGQSLPVFISR